MKKTLEPDSFREMGLFRGQLQVDAKNSKFDQYESALCVGSTGIPWSFTEMYTCFESGLCLFTKTCPFCDSVLGNLFTDLTQQIRWKQYL